MRTKAGLLTAVLALCGALAFAQQRPSTSSSGQTGSMATTPEQTATSTTTTIRGCLTGTTGNYMLSDANGTTYEVQGDESQLSANLNKEVEVSGTTGARASASATNSPETSAPSARQQGEASASAGNATGTASAGTASAQAANILEMTSIRKVSDTCSTNK